MKKVSVILLVLCLAGIGLQAKPGLTVGASYWKATLEYAGEEGESGNLFGPYVSAKFDKISLSAAWLVGEYDFGSDYMDWKYKRSDLSFSLGYSVSRNVSLFGAYKTSKYELESNVEWLNDREAESFDYAGGGISLMFPFTGSPLFLYGSYAYLASLEDEENEISDLTSTSIGIGYYNASGLTLMLGYRADMSTEDNDAKEKGLLVTIAYSFR